MTQELPVYSDLGLDEDTVSPLRHLKNMFFIDFLRERKGEIDRNINKRETLIGCLLHIPHWGPSLQPGHVP